MRPSYEHDLPPLGHLDLLDQDLAADMLYNRPLYASPAHPQPPASLPCGVTDMPGSTDTPSSE